MDFIWDTYCSWYIELAKARLQGENADSARRVLVYVLTGVLKLEQVEGAAGFLVQVMPVTFIPAVGGIVGLFDQAKSFLVALVLIPVLSFFAVLGVTGRVTQAVIRREARRNVK